jgi:NAD(P)-dependent dehydrogenase (short-subunit alcohol dehydrogenase family)
MFRLDGLTAVVVGCESALRVAIVRAMIDAGARIVSLPTTTKMTDAAAAIANAPDFDVLVNLAGFDHGAPLQSVLDADLDEVIEETIEGSFLVSQAAALKMGLRSAPQAAATIVHVGTPLARVGANERSLCCMAMHALRGLTMASAAELGALGIRVNLLEANLDEGRERALSHAASVESVAAGVVYLASPAATAMTGASLLLDAGWTAR